MFLAGHTPQGDTVTPDREKWIHVECGVGEELRRYSRAVVPKLGPLDVLGLPLPESFTTTLAGQDFWELKSKNLWRPKVGDHWFR